MGVGTEIRALFLVMVGIMVIITTAISMRRVRQAFVRIETQFAALARGDLQRVLEIVPVHELRAIGDFLRSLRAKLTYSEEARAQKDRDSTVDRVTALREMAHKVETAANQSGDEVAATTASMTGDANGMVEAAATLRTHANTAAQAASESMSSAQTVAAAAEQLSSSIREIANQITVRAMSPGRPSRTVVRPSRRSPTCARRWRASDRSPR
jgi:aerotaxis receptor